MNGVDEMEKASVQSVGTVRGSWFALNIGVARQQTWLQYPGKDKQDPIGFGKPLGGGT